MTYKFKENEEVSRLAAAYLFFENTSQAIRHLMIPSVMMTINLEIFHDSVRLNREDQVICAVTLSGHVTH